MDLTTAAREYHELLANLAQHRNAALKEEARLVSELAARKTILQMSEDGIDAEKVALAKTIIFATDYAKGGDDRGGCRSDAIKQLSTGAAVRPVYGDLWRVQFATKSYDRWHGQRSDCEYGCGPRHGSIIFRIGITDAARKRQQADLTAAEVEAAIYYLINLERIQTTEQKAALAVKAA